MDTMGRSTRHGYHRSCVILAEYREVQYLHTKWPLATRYSYESTKVETFSLPHCPDASRGLLMAIDIDVMATSGTGGLCYLRHGPYSHFTCGQDRT
ncbi:hypothetical protein EVAR_27403_1 [Eumeta japonica]|uniref:Uncharacterized protein n=1 Tax=Eumeta variegata TaxID=151549 RepID=A0A4C1X312_EUMVA|nr:hypothetical protein EVAR_27403_1 [Eumeta japonica]